MNFCFQWHITDECDQRCKHCYLYNNKVDYSQTVTIKNFHTAIANIINFSKFFKIKPVIAFTGGDPLLNHNFKYMIQLCNQLNFPYMIYGNPFHIDKDICEFLKETQCESFQFSIDGLKTTHDNLRKQGSYDATIKAIKLLQKYNIKVVIMSTVSSLNISELPSLVDELIAIKPNVYAFARYCKTDNDVFNDITPLQYKQFLQTMDNKFQQYKDSGIRFNKKDHLWKLLEYEQHPDKFPKESLIIDGCHCGNSHLTILPNGDVMACRRVKDSVVGNIYKHQLVDLWLNEMEEYRQFDKFSQCSSCELLSYCRGCPAVAKSYNGSFYSKDPQCWKFDNKTSEGEETIAKSNKN